MTTTVIRDTFSVCPVCFEKIPAQQVLQGDDVYFKKSCKEHGDFSVVIWRKNSEIPLAKWRGAIAPIAPDETPNCPHDCGLCSNHIQNTCCVLIEVTANCNLACEYCLAASNGAKTLADPSIEQIYGWLESLSQSGKRFLQLSGGEPTIRDDLPKIISYAKNLGFRYIQLNTNGVRLAQDFNYLALLVDAGLSFVFLQFDGTNDEIYSSMRGMPLLQKKLDAIENCKKLNIGVVLVETLVPLINCDNIGQTIKLATSLSPTVRGVHFQPVSYFGRYPATAGGNIRLTLPELILNIEAQTNGEVTRQQLLPSRCDHPVCGFHGNFLVNDEALVPLADLENRSESCEACSPEQNQDFVGRRWERAPSCCDDTENDIHSFDGFLNRVRGYGFTITAMAFQDADTFDFERLRHCSLHVYADGKLMPLCARYLS